MLLERPDLFRDHVSQLRLETLLGGEPGLGSHSELAGRTDWLAGTDLVEVEVLVEDLVVVAASDAVEVPDPAVSAEVEDLDQPGLDRP